MAFETVGYKKGVVELLDQTLLPGQSLTLRITQLEELCEAIVRLRVRGAPAIGVAAAYGMAMVAAAEQASGCSDVVELRARLQAAAERLDATRPTARNLFMATERMLRVVSSPQYDAAQLVTALEQEALDIHREDRQLCEALAKNGAALLPREAQVLTHCNAGALATGGIGTALGVVYEAVRQGKSVRVFADETRPLLQGARLTAWELQEAQIPVTLLCDNAAASLMSRGEIDCVIVGADRIAGNGDAANKIGTLQVALTAKHFGVPFYVAAPSTTFDLTLASGEEIPIEQRSAEEVTEGFGVRTAPEGVSVFNPAFDVTPHELIRGIIHEGGVVLEPSEANVARSLKKR